MPSQSFSFRCFICVLFSTLAAVTAGGAQAQALGSAFSYQGQLKESGQPATGLFDLQACLYDGPINAAPLICAPDIGDVPVDGGLFTVALDFGAMPFAGQQRYLELRVRPGASIGSYTVLSPRQLLRATPEALRANSAPWTGLTAMPTGFIDGIDNIGVSSITAGAGLSGGTITTTGTLAIAIGGVGAMMIANNAVGSDQLASNAVDTAAIADANVTSAKIAPGAIGSAQINASQVQTRISGSCNAGDFIRGINADGSFNCELLPVRFDRVLDSNGDAGKFVAIALRGDDRPVLAYHENANGALRIYLCANAACTSGTQRTLDSAGDVGENIALEIRPNGFPVMAYRDATNNTLKLHACADAECATSVERTLDNTVFVGNYIDMALRADGRPFIAYSASSGGGMSVYDCANIDCSSGAIRPIASAFPTGVSVAIRSDGRPLVAIGGNAGAASNVRLLDCTDAPCTSGTFRTLLPNRQVFPVAMVLRDNGRPLIAVPSTSIATYDCLDAVCANSNLTTHNGLGVSFGTPISLKLRGNGQALIAYGSSVGSGDSQIRLFDCGNVSCTSGSDRIGVNGGDFAPHFALALRTDGRPVLAFHDATNLELRLRVCANPECI